MRVYGRGGGFGDQFPRERHRSSARAFARGRTVGQIVRGRFVAPAEGGLVWVSIDGHSLLASLDHPVPPGEELLFRIVRLDPDLLLQDITPAPEPGTDPARVLASLTGARSRLEALLETALPAVDGPPLDLTTARRQFRRLLAERPEARDAWNAGQFWASRTGALLPPDAGHFRYLPWLYPGLCQSELLVRRHGPDQGGPSVVLRLFGRLPAVGRLAILAAWHPRAVQYRLLLERPEAAETVRNVLSRVLVGRATYVPQCLATGPLPKELAGGLLAPLLAGRARPFTGLRLQV